MGQGTWDRGRFYNYTAGQGTVLCPILALIANIIIVEKQASIKNLIHQNTPRASPRGVALRISLCRVWWDGEPSPVPFSSPLSTLE